MKRAATAEFTMVTQTPVIYRTTCCRRHKLTEVKYPHVTKDNAQAMFQDWISWCFYGIALLISIGFLSGSYDLSLGFLREFEGISMVILWCFYGISMGFIIEFLWAFSAASMICLWDSYSNSMRFR